MCIFVTNILLFLIFRMAYVYSMRIDDGTLLVILDLPVELDRAQAGSPDVRSNVRIDVRINIRATLQMLNTLIQEPFKFCAVVNRSTKGPVRNVLKRNEVTLLSYTEMRTYMEKYLYQRIQIGIALTVC